ncbi:hypothetical protein [Maridesulfovibrio salexigens]|uniref:Uncharacterized protein n=1 Tax=Maridesulfovibrio salexigens (strain ATCC 14822 / DSM 2638 / NCIMB 8403 / VKM B-1763) TaxID=526222 RepID=C6BYV0_MARSD|nr:hypothetical protein [Maridesulfovibrio salexigens]ACS80707.1 conserved hypothetical protein [Maridesulfovibrio salexigens DSM 2638]
MRKAMKIVLALAMVLLMSGGAIAQETFIPQGSALVSGIEVLYRGSYRYFQNRMFLTNITDQTIQCRVTVFDHNGDDITHFGQVMTGPAGGGGGHVVVSSGTGLFEIPAHSTRAFWFGSLLSGTMTFYGHAVVEWMSNSSKLRRALIGSIYKFSLGSSSNYYATERDINGGQPF